MEDKELKKLLIQQTESLKKYVDKKFTKVDEKFETMDQKIDQSFADAQEQSDHQLQAMVEHFDGKFDGVMELVQDIPAIKAKLDIPFDKAGETAADHEVTKLVVKQHSESIAELRAH